MATRARARREFFDRSRELFDRTRVAAAHLLDPPRQPVRKAIEAGPAVWGEPPRDAVLVDVCASIALRDLNLIDSILSELERMERGEEDSIRLGQLYRLDHLTARLRRNAENLRVLADRDAGENAGDTTSMLDTVRAAMSSIDQYSRISIGRMVSLGVVGFAADDLSRVLTELLDNAANHSPPHAQVRVSAHLTEQGSVLIRIEDGGIGLPADRLAELNRRLSQALRLDDYAVRHMGLAVVGRLAERHDLRVSLHRRLPNGTTANVLVPPSLVTELPEDGWSGTHTVPVNGRNRYPMTAESDGPVVPADDSAVEAPPVTTAADLPHRDAAASSRGAAPSSSPLPRQPVAPTIGGTTASGLPLRVSRSIRKPPDDESGPAPTPDVDAADPDGHEKFVADLGDFAAGEQAAHANSKNNSTAAGDGDVT
jgi:anti-sigma regulatory factor (Ser/Thr protein kinase)